MPDRAGRLTDEDRKAIASLQRLAKSWPKGLTLLSDAGSLLVVPTSDRIAGEYVEERSVSIHGISNDGGAPDWRSADPAEVVWDD